MHFVYADPSRNLLHQILAGTLDRADAVKVLADVKRALAGLRPGYVLLSDLRDLRAVDEDAEGSVRELMELCAAHEPSLLVRILREPTANFGFTIMAIFHYRPGTPTVTCFNLEEAAAVLPPAPEAGSPAAS